MYKPMVEWARKRFSELTTINLPDLAEEVFQKFKKDPEFLKQCVYPAIRSDLGALVALTRKSGLESRPDDAHSMETGQEQEERHSSVGNRLEWTPRGHLRFSDMTRVDLRASINHRRRRWESEGRTLLFFEAIAMGLSNDTMTVGERYDPIQLYSMQRQYVEGIEQPRKRPEPEAAAVEA